MKREIKIALVFIVAALALMAFKGNSDCSSCQSCVITGLIASATGHASCEGGACEESVE